VRDWPAERVAAAAGARLEHPARSDGGPVRAVIDSREAGPGDLFVGLRGANVDGGRFAAQALARGAWGVLIGVRSCNPADLISECSNARSDPGGVLVAGDPLAALQALATAWRRSLAADVIGVTGSTGKTTTKDLIAAMVAQGRPVVATRENLNTEIGLPLTILEAPPGTEVLVLEMAMRGAGQIAELVAIAEPDVGLITNVGPVHLEQMGSIEAIAAEKSALVAGLPPQGIAIVPAGEPLLQPTRADLRVVTFGPGGDVSDLGDLELGYDSAHMRQNALAALAAARAVGVEPHGRVEVALSRLRGQRRTLPGGVTVIDDCYNANPMSMRAALDDLAAAAPGRRVAVLGDMLELGPDEERFHREVGEHARAVGVELLVTVGPRAVAMQGDQAAADAAEAAALVPELVEPGDTVLLKASRGVGLEAVAEALS